MKWLITELCPNRVALTVASTCVHKRSGPRGAYPYSRYHMTHRWLLPQDCGLGGGFYVNCRPAATPSFAPLSPPGVPHIPHEQFHNR
jgi:hypothetical protein